MKRYEIKFKIQIKDQYIFLNWLYNNFFFIESYNPRLVNSIYFDTSDYYFASSNMSGQSKRSKVRVRWYNENTKIKNLEIKNKINNLSDKIAFQLDSSSFLKNINFFNDLRIKVNSIISSNKKINFSYLREVVFIKYKRKYFELKNNKDIRITIDENLQYSSIYEINNKILLAKDFFIVEFKFSPIFYEKVQLILDKFPFRSSRNSKYLYAISQIKQVLY